MKAIQSQQSARVASSEFQNLLENVFRIAGVVRRRWRLIAVANLIFLTLAVFYLAKTKTVYKAAARLLVIQQDERPINVTGGFNPLNHLPSQQDALSTHMMIIRSPVIIGRALETSGRGNIPMEQAINRLKVQQPSGGGRILDLEYQSDTEEEALDLIRSLISSYDMFLKENYQKDAKEVITLFVKARDDLSKELKDLEQSYLEFRKQNPGLSGTSEGRTYLAHRVEQWDEAVGLATARALQFRAQLELAKKLSQEGASLSAITTAMNQLAATGVGSTGATAPGTVGLETESQSRSLKDSSTTYEQIVQELAEVEFQRSSAERILEHFQSQRAAMARERPVEEEILEAFYSEPDIAERVTMLKDARARHDNLVRIARSSSDPAILRGKAVVKGLEEEIGKLWRIRKNALRNKLRIPEEEDVVARSQTDVLTLRAREAFLQERAEETRTNELERLRAERVRLIQEHSAKDPRIAPLDARVAALEAGPDAVASHKRRGSVDALITSLDRGLEGVESLRAELQKRLDEAARSNHQVAINQLAESNLRYDLERQRTLFDSVAAQLKQAQLTSDYSSVTAQTINPPTVTPIRPWAAVIFLLALVAGSGCGTSAALLVEFLEARIQTISELRVVVDLPVITLIPRVSPGQFPGVVRQGLLCHTAPRSLVAELYKSVRTHLEVVRREHRTQVLLITSPNPGDGKSTTSSNLAICQANAGRRTLLIDADLRRPTIHSIHDLKPDPGLAQILTGELRYEDVVQPTEIPNLSVITNGAQVPNPAELLSSPRLGRFLEEARTRYDSIIIDASPLLAVTDPLILSAVVDGLILVVKIGDVRRSALERTMEILGTLGMTTFGVILNSISPDQIGFKGRFEHLQGYGYGYGYGQVYGSDSADNPPSSAESRPRIAGTTARTDGDGEAARDDAEIGSRASA